MENKSHIESEKIVQVSNLRISFDNQPILDDVSFSLYKGENLVILGKSGVGKSVLIKCISGLLYPDNGEIDVLGYHVTRLDRKAMNEMRKKIGFLFQGAALYDSMTVKENIEFPLIRNTRKMKRNDVEIRIVEALSNVGLADALYKMPSQLSGGMRKRVSLARTIVVKPEIILYDEPTTGLDPVTSDEISLLINEIKEKYNTSSIIITHDIQCAKITADRLIMLHQGKLYQEGRLNDFENSEDQLIRAFFK